VKHRAAPLALIALACLASVACATGTSGVRPRGLAAGSLPMELSRFMGDWYVIAHIPLAAEAGAHEAVERYTLREDGTIDVRFRFCEGSLEGPFREISMTGWVHDPSTNAEWRVRPIWPLRLTYQIVELDPDYSRTVVVYPPGGNAWIMARTPELDPALLAETIRRLAASGYDTTRLRRVPHDDGACQLTAGAD
jgi:apolipoprotein D and lipocalin family protein